MSLRKICVSACAASLCLFVCPPLPSLAGFRDFVHNAYLEEARLKIPRLHVVSPELVRGSQPQAGGLELLKKAGIRTIINLRDIKEADSEEEKQARTLGLRYICLPMTHARPIPDDYIEKFLSAVTDPRMQPAFVHCRKGVDRTGAMVAVYRLNRNGWSAKQSYEEMLRFGFHPIFRNLTRSVFAYAAQLGRGEELPPLADAFSDIGRRVRQMIDAI